MDPLTLLLFPMFVVGALMTMASLYTVWEGIKDGGPVWSAISVFGVPGVLLVAGATYIILNS